MHARIRHALLAFLILAPSAFAQSLTFGQPFPVANTRYGTAMSSPLLRTNGRDTFLFWINNVLRVTRVEKGKTRLGLPVFDIPMNEFSYWHFDAVWTGAHFVVAATDSRNGRIAGRIVDEDGRPQGEPFTIVEGGGFPRMAFNGKYILLIYSGDRWRSLALTPDGRPATFGPQLIGYYFSFLPYVASNGSGFAAILPDDGEQLLIFDQNAQLASRQKLADPIARWSLASDGRRYLAVNGYSSRVTATIIEPDGTLGNEVIVDQATDQVTWFRTPTAVWTSAGRWMIAYSGGSPEPLRIAELDSSGQQVVSRTTADAWDATIMTIGNREVAAWPRADAIYVGDLPLDVSAGEAVSYAPMQQRVLATTTSADGATLIVWQEIGDGRYATRAGVRTSDGRWRERELPVSAGVALASNDGHDFLVIANQTAVRLNGEGELVPGGTTAIGAFRPDAIAWNGSDYALVGMKDQAVVVALLTPSGSLSAPVPVAFSANVSQSPIIASDGDGFYVAWSTPVTGVLCEPICLPKSIVAIHLDAQLQPADPLPTVFGGEDWFYGASVMWNADHYVLALSSTKLGIAAARVGTTGGATSLTTVSSQPGFSLRVRPTTGAVAIGWYTQLYTGSGVTNESMLALLRNDDSIDGPRSIRSDSSAASSVLESLSGGRLAYIDSAVQNADPHNGASHVMMSVGAFALPQRPDAPRPRIEKEEHRLRIEWSTPPQPVTGYRVEYKLLDGATWNEFDQWFDPEQRVMIFVPSSATAGYSFRVRAFNDAGAGQYSETVSTISWRRRSVR